MLELSAYDVQKQSAQAAAARAIECCCDKI